MINRLKFLLFSKHLLLISFLIITLAVEICGKFLDLQPTELFIPRLILYTSLAVSIFIFPSLNFEKIQNVISLVIPLAALAVVALTITNTPLADRLAIEDGPIEQLSAFFLMIASTIMAALTVSLLVQRKRPLQVLVSAVCSLIFFIIGMEEISWAQRIIDIETPSYLIEINNQQELNFHNIATGFFERAYYLGGFILLTLLPFIRKFAISILQKTKLTKTMVEFLPSQWLVIPFSVISSFITVSVLKSSVYMLIYIFTFIILLATTSRQELINNTPAKIALTLAFTTFVIGIVTFTFTNYGDLRYWLSLEYREFFIALGIATYAFDTAIRMLKGIKIST